MMEHRRVLLEVIGDGDLSRPALVEARRRGNPSSPSDKQLCKRRRELSTSAPPLEEAPGASAVAPRSPVTVDASLRTASSR